ncbi:VOC family protein [Paracidovorax avenae]|uniref:VOC family protein n=1 Tax=Paracidovorax avenae TaxID=80867 RepID=UPI000D21BF20|nr:VOC family protein [Paracidovorax avenae]AVS82677.1 VOC family protein [Paracidovorax avenae]
MIPAAFDPARAACVDHLVVVAGSLEEGSRWCRRTLGVEPAAGGAHPLMGTHNRLLNISGPAHPRAYLEVIAIDPQARPALEPGRRRWFDMDDEAMRSRVARRGPQLVHWVASVPDIAAAHAALAARGVDRGEIITAGRPTPFGMLEWRITVRPDGARLMDGCLPTLIQWGERHPCHGLPDSGVTLESLTQEHPDAAALQGACAAAGVHGLLRAPAARSCAPRIVAALATPLGSVTCTSLLQENTP